MKKMSYSGFIVKLKNIRKHENADRLMCADVFGANVIIGLDYNEYDLYVYFPIDGQLSEEYANTNDLLRRKDESGNVAGGYLDPKKRNITAIRLRGEKSEGLIMPLSSLSPFVDITTLSEGDKIDVLNGHLICCKYIPNTNARRKVGGDTKARELKTSYPLFREHADTEQFRYNLDRFKPGDEIIITLKMHGTSGRTSHTIITEQKRHRFSKLFELFGVKPKMVSRWDLISGSRRRVLDMECLGESEAFRKGWHDFFAPKLEKGETVYYEILGASTPRKTIMPSSENAKINDKQFMKTYGSRTVFSYGCDIEAGENVCYVYRMTMTNEDGFVVEYPWDFVKFRAEQMGVKTCPELDRFYFTTEEDLISRVEAHNDGPDPVGVTHIREGVVIRIGNRAKFEAYKDKNFAFKVLEGIVKSNAEEPDIEEAEETQE